MFSDRKGRFTQSVKHQNRVMLTHQINLVLQPNFGANRLEKQALTRFDSVLTLAGLKKELLSFVKGTSGSLSKKRPNFYTRGVFTDT